MDDYSRMAALCSRREYCSYDISEKLRKRGLEEKKIAEILSRLVAERFVDDRRYARAYVNEKMRLSGWGEKKLEFTLRKKNLSPSVIAGAIAEVLEENPELVKENLRKILKAKFASISKKYDFSDRNEKNKCKASLLRYAVSKGYAYSEVIEEIGVFF